MDLEKACVSVEWTEGGATKGKEVGSTYKMCVKNGTCESLVVGCFLFQLAMIAPQINLMGCHTATKSLVFEAVSSSLISDMVLFGCTGILSSKASSKLKPVNSFWCVFRKQTAQHPKTLLSQASF